MCVLIVCVECVYRKKNPDGFFFCKRPGGEAVPKNRISAKFESSFDPPPQIKKK